jgi:hypothetical protein
MASCDNTVLTGQEGLIQFKPLGTTNCIDDFCPFVGTRIYLPCNADYSMGDCIEFETENLMPGTGQSDDGGNTVIEDGDRYWVVGKGVGAEGDFDACGNDVMGVPYIEVSLVEEGSAVIWNGTNAGQVVTSGILTGEINPATAGTGYNNSTAGTLTGVELISSVGSGKGAVATVTVTTGGAIEKIVITSGGSGYAAGDMLMLEAENGAGTDATFQVLSANVTELRSGIADGSYTIRLCDFQTVCGVRDFSIDLSRDELDVTTLPCSVNESCGKQLASFKKTQAGFATATGTLTVYFTCDQTSIQNKILQGSLQRTQGGATIRLYVCTKTDAAGEIIDADSLFIEADIQLLGLAFSVNPDDPTSATINFGVTDVKSAFGLS